MLKKRREVEEGTVVPCSSSSSSSGTECCMCGDYGLSSQLFKCKLCRFRFQHKYCSNLYPESDSYNTCNWCLVSHSKDHTSSKSSSISSSQSNSSSSKPNNHRQGNNCSNKLVKKRKRLILGESDDEDDNKNNNGGPNNKDIKQVSNSAQRVTSETGKRIIIKKVFRNKVRRYKLLEEVSAKLII